VEALMHKRGSLGKEVVIATRNLKKLEEIKKILSPLSLNLLSLKDFSNIPELLEEGKTFAQNAMSKAQTTARLTGRLAIADDSGLTVKALRGRPGVFSSRYAGEGSTDRDRIRKLLCEMADVPAGERQAAFVCVIAVALPEGKIETVEGNCEGQITFHPRGNYGFGYDPVFLLPEFGKTMAELEPAEKNRISHRAKALEKLKTILPNFFSS
jgi:XTP/dITP diphosphohydrolase